MFDSSTSRLFIRTPSGINGYDLDPLSEIAPEPAGHWRVRAGVCLFASMPSPTHC